MPLRNIHEFLRMLERRRRELGMSYSVLARRSGVSAPTLVRTLAGSNPNPSFASIVAMADALEVEIRAHETLRSDSVLEREAARKAERLVGMVQANVALEAQAVDECDIASLRKQAAHELLAGSKRRIWG